MKPEPQLLVACAILPMPPARVAQIKSLARSEIDWAGLLRLADQHRLLPVLAKQARAHFSDSVPPSIMRELQDALQQNTYRNLWQASELHRLIDLLAERGVRAVPYKGPVLANDVYGDLACRHLGDLDILIRPGDFQLAQQVLIAEQYAPYYQLSAAQTQAYRRYQRESIYQHNANGFAIDLHWGINLAYTVIDLERADLWHRLQPTMLAGKAVLALAPTDSLLLLAVHGAAHCWRSLNLVMDIGQTLRTHEQAIDWALLWREASRWHVERIVWLALRLAVDLTQVQLPPDVAARIERDGMVEKLARQVQADLFLPPREISTWDDLPFNLRMRERRRDQLQCVWDALTLPSVNEISTVKLPPALFPLYRVLRPVRLLGKYLRAMLPGKRVHAAPNQVGGRA